MKIPPLANAYSSKIMGVEKVRSLKRQVKWSCSGAEEEAAKMYDGLMNNEYSDNSAEPWFKFEVTEGYVGLLSEVRLHVDEMEDFGQFDGVQF